MRFRLGNLGYVKLNSVPEGFTEVHCPKCGNVFWISKLFGQKFESRIYNFCPICGFDMTGKSN